MHAVAVDAAEVAVADTRLEAWQFLSLTFPAPLNHQKKKKLVSL